MILSYFASIEFVYWKRGKLCYYHFDVLTICHKSVVDAIEQEKKTGIIAII